MQRSTRLAWFWAIMVFVMLIYFAAFTFAAQHFVKSTMLDVGALRVAGLGCLALMVLCAIMSVLSTKERRD